MPFEMKNLTSFPMEQLCFDLKLEMLEQMEPRDVVELTKVNQGFQGMLAKDPSMVFGLHVSRIQLYTKKIRIMKFSSSDAMDLNVNPPFSHFSFIKKIRSCDKSWLGSKSKKEVLERFFENFHASIKKEAILNIDGRVYNDQVIKDWIENFMVGPQLKVCEKMRVSCVSEGSVHFCYNALLKTEIKNVAIYSWNCIALIIQKIITNGIPSKNPEAAICLHAYKFSFRMDLSQYPGMRRIDGENRLRLFKQANYLRNCGYYLGSSFFREESSIFRRRFDSTKDCIWVYDDDDTNCVLAFYVAID